MAQDYRELDVWKMALELAIESYRLCSYFPPHERYGLSSQLRRAAVSVPANIAEGNGRLHRGDYIHHLSIARGSLLELATHLEIACRLDYIHDDDLPLARELIDHVSRMLHRLTTRLSR